MRIRHQALSDIGRRRRTNEDSLFAHAGLKLFVVADGMGGHAAGEVASKLAVEAIHEFVAHMESDEDPTWPYGFDEALGSRGNLLRTAVLHANRKVIDATREKKEYRGMATTVVAVLMEGDTACVAHAGDSRAYLLRDGRLACLTADHSWVGERVSSGLLTAAEARTHPLRSMVTRALGGRAELEVDLLRHPLRPGDLMLLCSDGLTGMLGEDEIRRVIEAAGEDLERAARDLVAAANERGGDDNVTVLLLRCEEGEE